MARCSHENNGQFICKRIWLSVQVTRPLVRYWNFSLFFFSFVYFFIPVLNCMCRSLNWCWLRKSTRFLTPELSFLAYCEQFMNRLIMYYEGVQQGRTIRGYKWTLWLRSLGARLIGLFVSPQFGSCFMSPFSRLEFWGCSKVLENLYTPAVQFSIILRRYRRFNLQKSFAHKHLEDFKGRIYQWNCLLN